MDYKDGSFRIGKIPTGLGKNAINEVARFVGDFRDLLMASIPGLDSLNVDFSSGHVGVVAGFRATTTNEKDAAAGIPAIANAEAVIALLHGAFGIGSTTKAGQPKSVLQPGHPFFKGTIGFFMHIERFDHRVVEAKKYDKTNNTQGFCVQQAQGMMLTAMMLVKYLMLAGPLVEKELIADKKCGTVVGIQKLWLGKNDFGKHADRFAWIYGELCQVTPIPRPDIFTPGTDAFRTDPLRFAALPAYVVHQPSWFNVVSIDGKPLFQTPTVLTRQGVGAKATTTAGGAEVATPSCDSHGYHELTSAELRRNASAEALTRNTEAGQQLSDSKQTLMPQRQGCMGLRDPLMGDGRVEETAEAADAAEATACCQCIPS